MSDNRFSLEDILNEHPRRSSEGSSDSSFDLDSILSGRSSGSSTRSSRASSSDISLEEILGTTGKKTGTTTENKPAKPTHEIKSEPVPATKPAVETKKNTEKPSPKPQAKPAEKSHVIDRSGITPIGMQEKPKKKAENTAFADSRTGELSPELKKALAESFAPKKKTQSSGKLGTAYKDSAPAEIKSDEKLGEFFGGGKNSFEISEEEEKGGILDSFKKLARKKTREKQTRKMEDMYTSELPTPDAIMEESRKNSSAYRKKDKVKPKKEAPVEPAEDKKPSAQVENKPKQAKVSLEMTGPLVEEKPEKKVKEHTGFFDRPKKNKDYQTGRLSFEGKDIKPIQPSKISGNTEIIENLIRIKKERGQRTAVIPPISRKSIADIDLNLDDKILPNTEPIPIDENASEMQKLRELKERRKKKINDFVLVGDEEENDEDEVIDEEKEITDFESFEDAPSVLNDILQLKSSLVVRLCFLAFAAVISCYISFANDFNLPIIEILSKGTQPTTYLFINVILGLLSAFVSYTVISCGITKLIRFQADCDSISAVAMIATLLSAMVTLANTSMVSIGLVNIYISVAIVSLLFNTIGKLLIVGRTEKSFQYIAGDYEHYAVFTIDDEDKASQFTRGALNDFPMLASMRKTEFISDFLKNSYSTDVTDNFCRIATPIICVGSLLAALLALIFNKSAEGINGVFVALSTFAGSVSVCSCFAIMLVVNMPMYKGTKKYLNSSAAMLSYQSVEEFSDTNSILLDVSQLFPEGMISLSAIKIFSDTRIDEAIVEAASLTNHSGSILKHMFYDIIAGKTELLNPVESYIYEDSMGLCGWINNKRVLLGNRELMTNHSIDGMPTKAREKEYTEGGKMAVYLSISGELSAMFVIEIKANADVKHWLKQLEREEVCVTLRTVDSVVSINKLAEIFEISPDMLKLLPFRLHPQFEEITSYVPKQSASLACIGRFPSFASLIIGTKRIRRTAHLGVTLQAAAGILGMLMALAFTLLSTFSQMTPSLVLVYNLAWAGLTVLLQMFRKT